MEEHKYYYDLFDCSLEDSKDWFQKRVFSKEEALSWKIHGWNRSYHEKLMCTIPGMPCSKNCESKKEM